MGKANYETISLLSGIYTGNAAWSAAEDNPGGNSED